MTNSFAEQDDNGEEISCCARARVCLPNVQQSHISLVLQLSREPNENTYGPPHGPSSRTTSRTTSRGPHALFRDFVRPLCPKFGHNVASKIVIFGIWLRF